MPSPVAHLSMGVALWVCLRDRLQNIKTKLPFGNLVLLALFLFFSMMPDLDAVLGILMGDMGAYHNQGSHSLLTALVASVLIMEVLRRRFKTGTRLQWALVVALPVYMHIFMDVFTHGRGIMLLWPITSYRFPAPFEFFGGLSWSEGLWYRGHLLTAAEELRFALVLALLVLADRFRLSLQAKRNQP